MSNQDQHTLDEYFTLVQETEKKLQNQTSKTSTVNFDELQRPTAGGSFDHQVTQMLDLMTMALWTDSTRVITYMLGNDNSRLIFDFLGIDEQHHGCHTSIAISASITSPSSTKSIYGI